MKDKKLKNVRLNLVSNDQNYMKSMIENVGILRTYYGWSVRVLAEKADMSFDTLQNFLKGKAKDCTLSTAVKLARAFGISLDELVGAKTIEDATRTTIAMAAQLDEHHRYVIRLFAKHQYLLHSDAPDDSKQISMLLPECNHGNLKTTNITEALNIDHLRPTAKAEACLALKIPCRHYEPYYLKDEILVLGAHRAGVNNERCVISKGGNMYICIKKIENINGQTKIYYISLIDGHTVLFTSDEIDDRIGYVIGFLYPNGEWGAR